MPPEYVVRLLPAAEPHFKEIIAYIALDNPAAAGAPAGLIGKKLAVLQAFPFRGGISDEQT
jgi:plasmid stabilization system protein ParE